MDKKDQEMFESKCQQLKEYLQQIQVQKYNILGSPNDVCSVQQHPKQSEGGGE